MVMHVADTMTAIAILSPGGPEMLKPEQRPTPTPKTGEVLIKVAAAGVNRPDVLQRKGLYLVPPGASDLPGLEVSGVIAAAHPSTERFAVGSEVVALCNGGGYAEYVCVPEGQVLLKPSNLSWVEAAAIPETFFTVWSNVFERAYAAEGDSILIHGGSSGIGTTAIHLAREYGLKIYTTAGSDDKCTYCVAQGADAAINYTTQDFAKEIDALTKGRGVDIVLDMVGGDYVPRNLACMAMGGRHVSIAVQGGVMATISLFDIMRKRLILTGSTLRPQSDDMKALIADSLEEMVWPALQQGRCKPVIDSVFALSDATSAHVRMESGGHMGKIVLEILR